MTRKTARDFHPQALKLFDQYVHGQLSPARLSGTRGTVRRARRHRREPADGAEPALRRGRAGVRPTTRGSRRVRRVSVAEGLRHDARLSGRAGQGQGQAAGRARGAREPRPQSAHRGHRAALALDNFMAFAPDALFPLGGYPGDEDKARELFAKLDQAKTREDFVAAATCLKSRPTAPARSARSASATAAASPTCWRRACPTSPRPCPSTAASRTAEDVAEDQGAAADPLRRERRAHQRGLARLRGGAQGQQE